MGPEERVTHLPISPTVRIWVVLTTSGVTRARLWASAGRLHALVGVHVVLTYVPNSFRFPTEVPETHCECRKKHCFVERIPKILEEPCVEIDEQKRKSEAAQHTIVPL